MIERGRCRTGMSNEQDERTLNMHVNKFVVPFRVHVHVIVVVVVYSAGVDVIGVVVVTDLHKLIKIIAARNANSWSVRSMVDVVGVVFVVVVSIIMARWKSGRGARVRSRNQFIFGV